MTFRKEVWRSYKNYWTSYRTSQMWFSDLVKNVFSITVWHWRYRKEGRKLDENGCLIEPWLSQFKAAVNAKRGK